jgi:hypothetical protein
MIVPELFLRELDFFNRIVPLDDTRRLTLAKSSVMQIPSLAQAGKCIFYASLDLVFSCLSVEHLLQAVSLFLLERQMVFVSSDLHRLTLSMLCIRGLAEPFHYRGAFLPILPDRDEYLGVLDAPTPYVVGVLKWNTAVRIPGGVCLVDLDTDTIADPENSPMITGADSFIRALKLLIEKVVLPPIRVVGEVKGVNPMYVEAVRANKSEFASFHSYLHCERKYVLNDSQIEEIVTAFEELVAPQLNALAPLCFVTDRTDTRNPVTVFNRELFIASLTEPARDFYGAFSQTTMFQEFIDKKMEQKSRRIATTYRVIPTA